MSGLIPAVPLVIIRPFLPESPAWARKKAEGTLKRPSFVSIFSPELRTTTVVTAIMFACSYGAAFGAIQQMPRMVPGLKEEMKEYTAKIEASQARQRERDPDRRFPPAGALAKQKLASDYTARRDSMQAVLESSGFRCFKPHGAYYIMTDVSAFGYPDDVSFVRHLIEDVGVAAVPGSSFFNDPADGSHLVRFCFCKKPETIAAAKERMASIVAH